MLKLPGPYNAVFTSPLLPGSVLSVVLAAAAGLALSHFYNARLQESAFMDATRSEQETIAPPEQNPPATQPDPVPPTRVKRPHAAAAEARPHEFVEDFPTAIPGL